jgi:hypothetical protein
MNRTLGFRACPACPHAVPAVTATNAAGEIQQLTTGWASGISIVYRWILKPGNDLFLVVNRGWLKDFEGSFEPSFDKASAKLQYTIRL